MSRDSRVWERCAWSQYLSVVQLGRRGSTGQTRDLGSWFAFSNWFKWYNRTTCRCIKQTKQGMGAEVGLACNLTLPGSKRFVCRPSGIQSCCSVRGAAKETYCTFKPHQFRLVLERHGDLYYGYTQSTFVRRIWYK